MAMNAVTMMLDMMGIKPEEIVAQVQFIGKAATEIRDAQIRIEAKLDAILANQLPSSPVEAQQEGAENGEN